MMLPQQCWKQMDQGRLQEQQLGVLHGSRPDESVAPFIGPCTPNLRNVLMWHQHVQRPANLQLQLSEFLQFLQRTSSR
jgi:hypothetical protein